MIKLNVPSKVQLKGGVFANPYPGDPDMGEWNDYYTSGIRCVATAQDKASAIAVMQAMLPDGMEFDKELSAREVKDGFWYVYALESTVGVVPASSVGQTHTISLSSAPMEGGTVGGAGEYG